MSYHNDGIQICKMLHVCPLCAVVEQLDLLLSVWDKAKATTMVSLEPWQRLSALVAVPASTHPARWMLSCEVGELLQLQSRHHQQAWHQLLMVQLMGMAVLGRHLQEGTCH